MPLDHNGNDVPFPNVPNVVKLAMKFTTAQNLDIVVNTHYRYTGSGPTAANLNTWLGVVATGVTTNLQPLMGTDVSHVLSTATDLTSPTAAQAVVTGTHVGSRAGGVIPINCAALFNMKIQRRYRGGKPRNYWPFGTTTDLADPAHWVGSSATAFTNGMVAFITGNLVTAGPATFVTLCNVSYYQHFKSVQNPVTGRWRNVPTLGPQPPYPYVDDWLSYSCSVTLGSQRRRLRPG